MKTLYTTLDRLRFIRDHIKKNWDVVEEWRFFGYASNGSPCLYYVEMDDGSKAMGTKSDVEQSAIYNSVASALGFDPAFTSLLSFLQRNDKQTTLDHVERSIAKLEEHETPPSPETAPEPQKMPQETPTPEIEALQPA